MKPWRGARALLSGQDPYQVILGGGNYPFEFPLFYPLPAAILSIPFGFIDDPYVAGAAFFGCSSALLAFAILRYDWKKFPVFLSAPFFISASVAQFTPLILALALMPTSWQSIALLTKPTSGLTAFLYKPSARTILIALILILPTLIWIPMWPIEWLTAVRDTHGMYLIPLLSIAGPLLLLGLLAWRSKEGRAFLGTTLTPHHPYWYESVLLWLVPQTLLQSSLLSLLSWVAYFVWLFFNPHGGTNSAWPFQLFLIYLPCAVLLAFPHLTLPAKKLAESLRSTRKHPNLE